MNYQVVHTEVDDKGFTYILSIAPEIDEIDWDISKKEKKVLEKQIEDGLLIYFVAKVEALDQNDNKIGESYIGGCCYASILDFIKEDGYYSDMKKEARRNYFN